MPYFISDTAAGCDGWATIKDDGEVIGCHTTKQAAIDQMVAVSIAEDMEPGGERALPNNYRPALAADVPDGRACGNCYFYDETNVRGDKAWCEKWDDYVSGAYYCNAWQPDHEEERAPAPPKDQITGSDENKPGSAKGTGGDVELSAATETALKNKVTEHNDAMTERDRPTWTRTTLGQLKAVYRRGSGAYSTSHRPGIGRAQWSMARVNAFLFLLRTGAPENKNYVTDNDLLPEGHPRSTRAMRAPAPPEYIQAAARKGLEYNRAGRGGDGLTDQTLREARLLADGTVSDDKIVRAAAWGARHAVDLEPAKNSNSNDREFPGAGAVAHYLWGINPLDPMPARDWFERQADMIKEASRGIDMTKIETREVQVQDLELREAPAGGMTFRGYAAVFNSDSQPLPFIEQISPGAFNRTLANRRNNVKMFVNHDDTMVLATTRAATLRLSEDSRGLIAEADLPDTTYGRDLSVLMQRGDVDSMSFGFSVPSGGDQWSNDGGRRTLNEVRLHEVSIVTGFPAYEATTATVRKVQHLATRTATDAEALADAMLALEAGQLTDDQANLLRSVVDKIGPEMEAQPTVPLSLLSQKLELMLKAV